MKWILIVAMLTIANLALTKPTPPKKEKVAKVQPKKQEKPFILKEVQKKYLEQKAKEKKSETRAGKKSK